MLQMRVEMGAVPAVCAARPGGAAMQSGAYTHMCGCSQRGAGWLARGGGPGIWRHGPSMARRRCSVVAAHAPRGGGTLLPIWRDTAGVGHDEQKRQLHTMEAAGQGYSAG